MSQKDTSTMIQSLWGNIRDIQSRINHLNSQLTTIESGGGGGGTVSANNGLSVSGSNAVLGQAISAVGDPAALTSNREIPFSTFSLTFRNSTGESTVFTPSTIVMTKNTAGTMISSTVTKTTNVGIAGTFTFTSVNFNGSFNSDTTGGNAVAGTKRFNTLSTGVTITPNTSNRMGCFQGTLGFENDVAGTNNTINIAGTQAVSVYSAKIDFWPNNGNQVKTITGTIAAYNVFIDALLVNSTIQTIVDYQSSSFSGNAGSPPVITNRYGFRCLDMTLGSQVSTNRWAFASEGATDMNWFNGFGGFGVSQPTHRVHIAAGTATVAPIVMTPGVVLTTPVNGALETDGTNLYFTVGGVRKTVTLT